ncbi:MAG: exo-alpha-sialidase [Pyrinomonadaceae bacterium]|nr:exo-alpha-sialidase [Pyrinomonadaceae bacterium]
MKKIFTLLTVAALSAMVFLPLGTHSQNQDHPQGPPQFLTRPILLHVSEKALDNGHSVFQEGPAESAVPGPLAPQLAPASFAPATTSALSLVGGLDRNISNSTGSYEGETGASAGATNGLVLVAGSNHIYPGACSVSAPTGGVGDCAPLAYSTTDGANWTKTALTRTWNNTTFGIGFDPGVDVDKTGTFYYTYGVAPLSGDYPNAIVMMKSTDGVNWTKATPVTFNTNKNFDDKYYLAIDRSNGTFANRIYVSWTRNSGNNQILEMSTSSNGGTTWSAPVKVNDGTSKFERVIGAYPAVDQNTGVVYDSWHDYARNIIYVDKSTNGGVTWGTDRAAATTHAGFGQDIGCVGGRSQGPAHALKVGPSGTLYLVYADPVSGRGFDVLFTKSTNGGVTWSTPISLNDDTTSSDQFQPTLSVESNGTGGDKVTVTFYDRRDDPADCLAHVYATQSTDNGATWSANVRQTSASSNFNGNPNGPGDYSSSAPWTGAVWPFFCDHRVSDYEIYTVNVQ